MNKCGVPFGHGFKIERNNHIFRKIGEADTTIFHSSFFFIQYSFLVEKTFRQANSPKQKLRGVIFIVFPA